jgi:large subunit ribosomal protein L31
VKEGIHPEYRKVLFIDVATGKQWVSRSTLKTKHTQVVEGEELPVVRLEISSFSHPFWTGRRRELDADGKIDRFRRRYRGGKKKPEKAEKS